jgi:type IV secretion system protein TrbL
VEFNTLTTTLTNFVTAFQGGYQRLGPAIHGLLASLAVIDIVLIGCWWALGGGEQLANVIKKILYLGFWLWLTTSFQSTAKAFVDSLIQAGLIAGGNPGGQALLLDPSRIASYGLQVTEPLTKAIENVGFDLGDALIFGIAYLGIMAAFLVMAIQVFLAVLEYYLLVAVVGILIPFGVLPATKFLAEKAIGAIVSAGIKLMVLAFIMAVAEPVLANIKFAGPEIKFNELWSVLLTSGAIAFLTWNAPSLAAGLLAGSPSLGAATMAQGAMASAGLAGGMADRSFSTIRSVATIGSGGKDGGGSSGLPGAPTATASGFVGGAPAGGSFGLGGLATRTPASDASPTAAGPASPPDWAASARAAFKNGGPA